MDLGQNEREGLIPLTRAELIVVAVVVVAMALLGLSSHFFGIPAPSPDVPACEMAGNCGGNQYLFP